MADAAMELECGCGQKATVNVEGMPEMLGLLYREFWAAHAGHRAPEGRSLGFDLKNTGGTSISAVASVMFDGEDQEDYDD